MALGSGVIIDAAKGYVVTNNHVVDNATVIKVQLSDGRKFDAKIVGKDPRSDIALIQIQDPKNLTAIKLADSDTLRVGITLSPSVTRLVSARRSLPVSSLRWAVAA